MGKIERLSEETINRIAAGEVIESPASVVKELIENSVDAGAQRITIAIEGGGFQKIVVADDGCGMEEEEALLSLERHATSKLRQAEDLFTLQTMGFRGEALAAIAAIAHLDLITSTGEVGSHLAAEGGVVTSVRPRSRGRGTTIEITRLFEHVPARKKFQKSSHAARLEIQRTVVALALAHPEVGYTFTCDGEEVFQLASVPYLPRLEQLRLRVKQLLPDEFSIGALVIEAEGVFGLLAAPLYTRPNRVGQYLYINRRPIVSPAISRMVKDLVSTQIASDRYPLFVLHMEIPGALVDVNVHPQKREVRLADEGGVRQRLYAAVGTPLRSTESVSLSATPLEPIEPWALREESVSGSMQTEFLPSREVVGIWRHILFVSEEEGLLAVDLWKAQEELAVERRSVERQGLLPALPVSLSPAEVAGFVEREKEIEAAGFTAHMGGRDLLLVEAAPPFLRLDRVADVLRTLCTEGVDVSVLFAEARRGRKRFTLDEGVAIWEKLKRVRPNSRAAVLHSLDAVEDWFKEFGGVKRR
jgi:DNA mismatch repair protein MutL